MSSSEPVVVDAPGRHRFEIRFGDQVAGFAAYVDDDAKRIFYHTEIGPEFGGRGLAGTLVREALVATRDGGKRIVPVCPYVRKWLSTHAEEAGLAAALDAVTPQAIAVAERAMAS